MLFCLKSADCLSMKLCTAYWLIARGLGSNFDKIEQDTRV